MSDPQNSSLVGRIAVHLKMVTLDQLAAAMREQERGGGTPRIGAIMLEMGFITQAQLQQLIDAQKRVIAQQRAREAVDRADAAPELARPAAAPASGSPGAPAPRAGAPRSAPPAAVHANAAAPAGAPAAAASPAGPALHPALLELLRRGVEAGASDVHVHGGLPPRLRVHGRFSALDLPPVAPRDSEAMLLSALDEAQRALLAERGELDFSCSVPGVGRFRSNVFRQQNGLDGVFRSIPARPPTLEELGLPRALARFTGFHQGLVLVTGPANCGKSATLAALVDIINEERTDHILTIEDPIEVLHPSKRCLVNQRDVGRHTGSFARALRAALREDPDVIVIGELRDFETISLALTAAETGHLVLGSLHTNSAIRTINRLAGVFPADQQDTVRSQLSESLRAVISQRLIPTADGSRRVPALEILVANKAVGNLIRENKTFQIQSILQTGAAHGMCLLDDALNRLVKERVITKEEALLHCEERKRITG